MTSSISPTVQEKLSRFAIMTKSDINTVLEDFLDEKIQLIAAVQEGLDDFAAGRVVDHDKVIARARATVAEAKTAKS